ncbi:MAG: AAA family ATPase [Syntrophus sp. (in: bacteria)]
MLLLKAIWELDISFLVKTEYKSFELTYDNGSRLILKRIEVGNYEVSGRSFKRGRISDLFESTELKQVRLLFEYDDNSREPEMLERTFVWISDESVKDSVIDVGAMDRTILPGYSKWGENDDRYWVKTTRGTTPYTRAEMVEKFLNPRLRLLLDSPDNEMYVFEEWLHEVTTQVPIRMLDIYRINRPPSTMDAFSNSENENQESHKCTVEVFAADLKKMIDEAHNSMAEQASDNASTFPQRLIKNFSAKNKKSSNSSEEAQVAQLQVKLQKKLDNIKALKERLCEAGILSKSAAKSARITSKMNLEILNVLSLHFNDEAMQLAKLEGLLTQIELFRDNINSKLDGKKIVVTRTKGFLVIDTIRETEIPLRGLSSGEQHEIVMIFDLIFNVTAGTLVLIDEPELSLHVEWQDTFVKDVVNAAEIGGYKTIITTHSPAIIQDVLDWTIDLYASGGRHGIT